MAFLRSVLHMLFMVVTVIPWALVVVIASPFASSDTLYKLCIGWLRLVVNASGPLLGIRNRITGMENLPQDGSPVLLLSKHQSTWETFALPVIMPSPLAFVFKRELLYVPFFGWALGRLDMVHIDRSKRSEAFGRVVSQGRELLEKGIWVIMFPEGTRIARGEVGNYRSGGTRLAVAMGVPVVPIAVTAARCWPRRAFIKHPGMVDISIGKPIPSEGRDPDELTAEVKDWIETEMRRLDPQAYR